MKLIIIDPITAYLGATDSHKTADVRALLAPVSDLAARFGVAIVTISHLNKSGGSEAMGRVTGSVAFVAAARGAYPHPEGCGGCQVGGYFSPSKTTSA